MKYPKLWDGPSPVGEALVRALQQTDAPYLSASTPDGVFASKSGRFQEVRQGRDAEFLTWQGFNGWASATNLIEPDFANKAYTQIIPRGRFRPRGTMGVPRGTGPLDDWRFLYRSEKGSVFGGGRVVLNLNTYGPPTGNVDQVGFRFGRFTPTSPSKSDELLHPIRLGYYKVEFLHGTRVAGERATHFFQPDPDDSTFNSSNISCYKLEYSEGGPHVTKLSTPIALAGALYLYGGFRISSNTLGAVFLQPIREPYGASGFDNRLTGVSVITAVSEDGGLTWVSHTESVIQSLFTIEETLTDPTSGITESANNIFREFRRGAAFACASDGKILSAFPAARGRNESTAPNKVTLSFDLTNTDPYGPSGQPNNGVTVFRGDAGAMQPVARLFIPGFSLSPAGGFCISGGRVLLLVTRALAQAYDELGAPALVSGWYFFNNPVYLLYSDDHGETWGAMDVGTQFGYVGLLSVAADGSFLLPIRIADTDDGDPQFGVFSFTDPEGQWAIIGRMKAEHPYKTETWGGVLPQVGAVLHMRSKGRWVSTTPGQPWLSDDRITPPWMDD